MPKTVITHTGDGTTTAFALPEKPCQTYNVIVGGDGLDEISFNLDTTNGKAVLTTAPIVGTRVTIAGYNSVTDRKIMTREGELNEIVTSHVAVLEDNVDKVDCAITGVETLTTDVNELKITAKQPGPQGPKGDKGDRGDKGGPGAGVNIYRNEDVAVGVGALHAKLTGRYPNYRRNAAFGWNALHKTISSGNAAFGWNALGQHVNNITRGGGGNTALGYAAFANLLSGDQNLGVGFGVTVPSSRSHFYLNIGNTIKGSMRTGNLTLKGVLTENSDERLKENIQTITHGLECVKKLRPVKFTRRGIPDAITYDDEGNPTNLPKDEDGNYIYPDPMPEAGQPRSDKVELGLIAQEVQKVCPELVTTSAYAEKYLAVDYGKVGMLLVNAVQQQQAQNDALKAQNEALEARIEALEANSSAKNPPQA